MTFAALRFTIAALALGLCGSCARPAAACALLDKQAANGEDASSALMDCVARLPSGGQLLLKPAVYRIERPIVIDKPVTIATAGVADDARTCAALDRGCATLLVDPSGWRTPANTMPIEVTANDVTLDHLVIRGAGSSPRRRADCRAESTRPLGGGIRVSGSRFTLRRSVVRDFTCYTAMEIIAGAGHPTVEASRIGPNGDHRPGEIWSDGLTIHDADHAIVSHNMFVDNTDVQLIFGGCRDCLIEGNRFRHTGPFEASSFAELMLQAWPNTSGNYSGTIVRGNSIDCGPRRRCGFGLMVGSAPWYPGPTRGASISDNAISNAMMAIDVDGLSGPVEMRGNVVSSSGGRFDSACGTKDWPAVNVAPSSRPYLRGDPSNVAEGSVSTAHCLLNRTER